MIRRCLLTLLLLAPTLAAAAWSSFSAALALWATLTLPPINLARDEWQDPTRTLEIRRQIQKHFLDHSIYLPLEDILTAPPHDGAGADPALLMQKVCGRGRLFIWIPFKFKLPITGEKVLEWCWKPQTKDV